jgi:hypothetical protein
LVSEQIANQLKIQGTPESLCMAWTDDSVHKDENSRRISIEISGVNAKAKVYKLKDVRTISTLSLPVPQIDPSTLKRQYKYLENVNFPPFIKEKPGILIGLEHAKLELPAEIKQGTWNEPIATKTRLGWVLHGKINVNVPSLPKCCTICTTKSDESLHELIKSFFDMESIGVPGNKHLESKQNERALKIMETTTRHICNRIETGLLWNTDYVDFPGGI